VRRPDQPPACRKVRHRKAAVGVDHGRAHEIGTAGFPDLALVALARTADLGGGIPKGAGRVTGVRAELVEAVHERLGVGQNDHHGTRNRRVGGVGLAALGIRAAGDDRGLAPPACVVVGLQVDVEGTGRRGDEQ